MHIVDSPSDELLFALYQRAAVFVFPAVEDFGIMPVEAMALGTPVVVGRQGGAAESVEAVMGGVVTESWSPVGLRHCVSSASGRNMTQAAELAKVRFGDGAFASRLKGWTHGGMR